jgi:hypothetical protein
MTQFEIVKDKYPPVAYYILDFKDKNLEWYLERFGNKSVRQLSNSEFMLLAEKAMIYFHTAINTTIQ